MFSLVLEGYIVRIGPECLSIRMDRLSVSIRIEFLLAMALKPPWRCSGYFYLGLLVLGTLISDCGGLLTKPGSPKDSGHTVSVKVWTPII